MLSLSSFGIEFENSSLTAHQLITSILVTSSSAHHSRLVNLCLFRFPWAVNSFLQIEQENVILLCLLSLCLLRFPWSVQVDLHRSYYHWTCSCLDNLCLLGLSWVVNSVPHWSHAKEMGFLHITFMYASSSLLVSDNSFPH